jgi:mono/diheme cytochrome c family protein
MTVKLRTVGIVFLLGTVFAAGAGALVAYLGVYNISATRQHTAPVYHLLDYAMRRSVRQHAAEVPVPDLSGEQRVLKGASHYRGHCFQCHGAPGVAPHDLAYGMTPAPANLVATAREWHAADIYWVIRHGIKMSGMPAWEYRLSDSEIWDIVAFVLTLPTLSPREYAALDARASEAHPHAHAPATGATPADEAQGLAGPPAMRADAPRLQPQAGNIEAGRRAVTQYLCGTCHQIPGIVAATRHVGPPLNGIGKRRYIGGVLLNNTENMVRWLRDPQHVDPLSAMPNLGVTEKDARDMAAFLATLEDLE